MKKMLLLGMLSVFLFSCKNDNKVENVERAFYYWKSDGSIDGQTRENIDKANIKKVYVKYFLLPSPRLYSHSLRMILLVQHSDSRTSSTPPILKPKAQ